MFSGCASSGDALAIHFIDAGEGDAVLIESPGSPKRWALVDAGNLISGFRVYRYLEKTGVDKLDYMIFTHPHADHAGGAFHVLQAVDAQKTFDNGQSLQAVECDSDFYRWYTRLVRGSSVYEPLGKGDSLRFGGATLRVIWPDPAYDTKDFNSRSLVVKVEYGEFSALLAGDLVRPAEPWLIETGEDLKADVLKVGHHGAADSSGREFLRRVAPETAVISVDRDNVRGYPSAQTVRRLEEMNIRVYRTDADGDIVVTAGQGGGFSVRTSKR